MKQQGLYLPKNAFGLKRPFFGHFLNELQQMRLCYVITSFFLFTQYVTVCKQEL